MIDAETKPTGLLLAGGQSRRMSDAFAAGRGDKGLLDLSGKPMLGHVIERLTPQAGRLVINANGDPARFASFDLPVVPDTIEGYAGPLAGILAGLRWSIVNAPDATHVVSVSTDAPFLPADLVTKLQQGLANASGSIALAQSGGELHPVIGLWPVALADDLEQALHAGTRKVLAWTDRHGTVPVEFPFTHLKGRSVDPFFNANTPEELTEARHLLAG
ncbi:MAG: molybdenum cofactor guanylyltransferase MobA [Hyphomicrobium sp.]